MLHHLSIGVRDLALASRFYDAVLGSLGYKRVFEDDTAIGYGVEEGKICFAGNCVRMRMHPVRDFISRSRRLPGHR